MTVKIRQGEKTVDNRIMQTHMQEFHSLSRFSKVSEYLLITHSFPHSPQVFPQELSTGKTGCGYSQAVHIKPSADREENMHFSGSGCFYHGRIFVQKFGLDSRFCLFEKTEEFFEIGG